MLNVNMLDKIKKRIKNENLQLSYDERMKKFAILQRQAFEMLSEEGLKRFIRRNHKKRAVNEFRTT